MIKVLVACRLIALNKCPGVRPFGIGEVVRRILGKVISRPPLGRRFRMLLEPCRSVLDNRRDVKLLYMPREISLTILTLAEAILLVHVDAFNLLNRKVVLLIILRKRPSLAKVLINTNRHNPQLFVDGDPEVLLSQEGTTQGIYWQWLCTLLESSH